VDLILEEQVANSLRALSTKEANEARRKNVGGKLLG